MRYLMLLTNPNEAVERWERLTPEEAKQAREEEIPKWGAFMQWAEEQGSKLDGLDSTRRRPRRPSARQRRGRRDRRPVPGDEGADRRLLHRGLRRPRPGDRRRLANPDRRDRLGGDPPADRAEVTVESRLPRGVGPRGLDPDPRPRRLRPRRGRGTGRVRDRARALAADGTPRNPGAWIVTTARNRAIDRIRRERTLARKTELLARLEELEPRRTT